MGSNVLIAASGTGGHIYPALAIADAIREMDSTVSIRFVGTPRGLENKLIPQANYPLDRIWIGRLNSNVAASERIKTLMLMPWALLQCLYLLVRWRPRLVLGVGGHASGPLLLMASLLRSKTFIWEPNAYPGLANRILARFADECLVVFSSAKEHLKTRKVKEMGFPIREEFEKVGASDNSLGGAENPVFKIFIFGGSQGARGLNTVISEAILAGGEWLKDFAIVHQTGAVDYERIQGAYGPDRSSVQVFKYIDDMKKYYQWADLVICRSGTGTLSELAALGKPALLVPLPFSADDHQTKNAKALADRAAAQWVSQKDFTVETFKNMIIGLKNDRKSIKDMSENIKTFYRPQAAKKLAKYIMFGE